MARSRVTPFGWVVEDGTVSRVTPFGWVQSEASVQAKGRLTLLTLDGVVQNVSSRLLPSGLVQAYSTTPTVVTISRATPTGWTIETGLDVSRVSPTGWTISANLAPAPAVGKSRVTPFGWIQKNTDYALVSPSGGWITRLLTATGTNAEGSGLFGTITLTSPSGSVAGDATIAGLLATLVMTAPEGSASVLWPHDQRLFPSSILSIQGLAGTVDMIDETVESSDGQWLTVA